MESRNSGRSELKIWRRGFFNSNSCDLQTLIEACPFSKSFQILKGPGSLAARINFHTPEDAVEAFVYVWNQKLLGFHSYTPEIRPVPENNEIRRRIAIDFLKYVRSLRHGEAASKCRKEMEEVEMELSNCNKRGKRRNKLGEFHRLEGLKQGLRAQMEILRRKMEEFERALQCLEFYLENQVRDCESFDNGEEKPVFVLGNGWTWDQLHAIILRECSRFESGLPMYSSRRDILQMVHSNKVMVLIGETGSGKSTQLVQFLADSGFALKGSLVCTQPRKVAAMSLAQRVTGECRGCYSDAHPVSCCTTYTPRENYLGQITYMTDHGLLQLCMSDKELANISLIIVDEAHERSLSTDLLLALLKRCLVKRPQLRLIIMSATADAKTLSNYFSGCTIFHVPGRNFPVDVNYIASDEAEASQDDTMKYGQLFVPSYASQVLKIVGDIHAKEEEGAILAFLTSQFEVEWARDQFQKSSAMTLALHGKLSIEEQNLIFENPPFEKRKVIFATNVAETSLTIPGVRFVVDSGMVKESRFDPKTGMNVLRVCQISQSAAAQRSGRAGRTQPGVCYRLYTEEEFNAMAPYRDPEILRVHIGIAILKLLALGIEDLDSFDFVQAPSQEAINMAVKNLIQLGAVNYNSQGCLKLTECGEKLVKLGVEPRLGKIILESFSHGLGREGLVLAAVMANASSIFCRVGTDEEKAKSDRLKLRFCHPDGDLFTLLAVYKEWVEEQPHRRNRWCWENSINAKTMVRCRDAIAEMELCLMHELSMIVPSYWCWSPVVSNKYSIALRRVILSSMVENLAMFSGYERVGYDIAATGQQAFLHPSSSLLVFGNKPTWIVFGELLCTRKQYLLCATVVEQDWLSAVHSLPYDLFQLNKCAMQKKAIPGLGRCLLKRLCGKSNYNLHLLLDHIKKTCNNQRFGIEIDHGKQEIQLFAMAEKMGQACGLLKDVLDCERRWICDECMEKSLFYASRGKYSPVALFGAGAEIKHLELEEKYLSVEVCHSNAQTIDDREMLLLFEKRIGRIAGFHKYLGSGQGVDSGKWGIVTFFTPQVAQTAVHHSNKLRVGDSCLTVSAYNASPLVDHKRNGFPAVKATLTWPRRQSKGIAIILCSTEDVDRIAFACSGMFIGRSCVRCRRGKTDGSVFMTGLDTEVTESELLQVLRNATDRKIMDAFILRHPADLQPSKAACEAALLQELSKFVPRDKCQVFVQNADTKDFSARVLVTFDGSIHLRAAMALSHLQGNVLSVCKPWQKITCEQTFYSTILCPAPIYSVLNMELRSQIESLQKRYAGLNINMSKTEHGSFRVKIFSNAMGVVAKCRSSLEELLKGTVIADDRLDPAAKQLLFTREGVQLLRSLEKKTKTHILFERRSLSIKIFGPRDKTGNVGTDLIDGLMLLHENKDQEIFLRGEMLPHGLMKEIVKGFGVDLCGLKELIPEAEFVLDTRRHVLSVHGSRETKAKAAHVVTQITNSLKGTANKILNQVLERENPCPICLCDIEDCYQLEGCGHQFCRSCLIDQCNSAMRHHEGSPLSCAYENCGSFFLIADLRHLLSFEQLDELFRASLGAFVASSNGTYKFCSTPDCPSVYEVSTSGRLFVCGSCSAELCTTCHLEYHPYVSCDKYREYKQDPDASLKEWCKGKVDVKKCPSCGFTIEKIEGCNHVSCKCGKHICWVCLESFDSSDSCYSHLRSGHGTSFLQSLQNGLVVDSPKISILDISTFRCSPHGFRYRDMYKTELSFLEHYILTTMA